jgi:hypothetical protein
MSIKLRPSVQAFAEAMEKRLRKHDNLKGPEGWVTSTNGGLMSALHEEVAELQYEIRHLPYKVSARNIRRLLKESIDVGNYAMMIWEINRKYFT